MLHVWDYDFNMVTHSVVISVLFFMVVFKYHKYLAAGRVSSSAHWSLLNNWLVQSHYQVVGCRNPFKTLIFFGQQRLTSAATKGEHASVCMFCLTVYLECKNDEIGEQLDLDTWAQEPERRSIILKASALSVALDKWFWMKPASALSAHSCVFHCCRKPLF